MIEGSVWGGACETIFACDLIIASPSTTFAVTPSRLGVPYNVSGVLTFFNAAPYRLVKEMAFTAKPMSAQRAEQVGMINYVIDNEQIEEFTYEMAPVSYTHLDVYKRQIPLNTSFLPSQAKEPRT